MTDWDDFGFLSKAAQGPTGSAVVSEYHQLAQQIPDLLDSDGQLGDSVNALPRVQVQGLDRLEAERLKSAAAFLSQAYVWGGPQPLAPARRVLHPTLSHALVETGRRLDEVPVFNYADDILRNWYTKPGAEWPYEMNDLDIRYSFTRLPDERGFNIAHVLYEYEGAQAIKVALALIRHRTAAQHDLTLLGLAELVEAIRRMRMAFLQVVSVVSPERFRSSIRPYLMGWFNVVKVEYIGQDVDTDLRGETGAQSSVLPALDVLLGISEGIATSRADHGRTYVDWRKYMPATARDFLHNLPKSALRTVAGELGRDGVGLYEECVEGVREMRSAHLRVVTGFLSGAGNSTGTGGTDFKSYLSYTASRSKGRLAT